MKVKVANRVYRMSKREYLGLLEVASQQVKRGIYAIEKNDYAELRADKCSSITKVKELIRKYKEQGFKVYANIR